MNNERIHNPVRNDIVRIMHLIIRIPEKRAELLKTSWLLWIDFKIYSEQVVNYQIFNENYTLLGIFF